MQFCRSFVREVSEPGQRIRKIKIFIEIAKKTTKARGKLDNM